MSIRWNSLLAIVAKLMKITKVFKVALIGASAAAYAWLWTWDAAMILLYALAVHESGHLWMARRLGYPTRGMFFLPFLGAVALIDERVTDQRDSFYVAIAGPIAGIISAIPLFLIGMITENTFWYASTMIVAMINMFNLLPIGALDGGHVLKTVMLSLFRQEKAKRIVNIVVLFMSISLCSAYLFYVGAWTMGVIMLLSLLDCIGYHQMLGETVPMTKREIASALGIYVVTIGLVIGILAGAATVEGGDVGLKAFFGDERVETGE